jgi:hypothetical protein
MTDRELKQAAVNRAAQHACAVMDVAECHTPEGRQRLRDAARMLQQRLNDLYAVASPEVVSPIRQNGGQL